MSNFKKDVKFLFLFIKTLVGLVICRKYFKTGSEIPEDIALKYFGYGRIPNMVDGFKFNPDDTVEINDNGVFRLLSEEDTAILRLTHGEYFGGTKGLIYDYKGY